MRMRKKKHCGERLEKCSSLWIKTPEECKGNWSAVFGNANDIHIEIGCGKGRFITEMAKQNPDLNFIAIDSVADVAVIALEKAVENELKNVRFVIADAARLCDYFEYDEIKRIYLNFSDPWKKSRQAKRRLTHKNFLDIYKKLLKNGNLICFKTDNKALFEFSLNSFAKENFKLQNITFDLHNSGMESNVMTEYEIKFSQEGMQIYRLEAKYLGWTETTGD